MNEPLRATACSLAILLASVCMGRAQDTAPRIGCVYPAGGQRGTTFEVIVGGQRLGRYSAHVDRAFFTGSGIKARVLRMVEPLTSSEVSALRNKLNQLRRLPADKRDAKVRLEMARLERQIATYMAETTRRQTQPALSEAVALEVTIDADAEPGMREMRVESARGISNPVRFYVDVLPEFRERPPDVVPPPPEFAGLYRFPPLVTTDITLPAVANGQVIPREPDYVHWQARHFTPGEADRYRFQARKGQRLVIAASARNLIPYLADAVPGWFQATLALYDAQGNELAYCDDYRFRPDPVLLFEVPEDGRYSVEIKDAIYRGRADFVYRIRIGELPFVTSIFPLGGPAGSQTLVKLSGWNLPTDRIAMNTKGKPPGIYPLRVRDGDVLSNTVPFAVDTLPECFEKEANDSPPDAQRVTLPVIVNGRIDRPGDWDVFRFEGRDGQQIVAEVTARRLDSPLDSVLELIDAAGNRLAFNDDHDDKAAALYTHQADSMVQLTLPADGS